MIEIFFVMTSEIAILIAGIFLGIHIARQRKEPSAPTTYVVTNDQPDTQWPTSIDTSHD